MESTDKIKTADERFQNLLGSYLHRRASRESSDEAHLDQDTLSAFAEGTLSRREASPVVNHLADCTYCRHITSELVRLDIAFSATENPGLLVSNRASAKVSEVLSGLLARIFGTGGDAVIAHNEPEDENENKSNEDEKET